MSFSCGRVVQFVIVGPLHRKRSEGADDDERTTIRSQRERSELRQTPTKTLQPQCQPQAGARLHPRKNQKPSTKTKTLNENLKRKPFSFSLLVLVKGSCLGLGFAVGSNAVGPARALPPGRPTAWLPSRM